MKTLLLILLLPVLAYSYEDVLKMSKGGTGSSAFASGGMCFSNGTQLTTDATKIFWDNVNKRLGLGTASPVEILSINATGGVTAGFMTTNSNTAETAEFGFRTNAGTDRAAIKFINTVGTGGADSALSFWTNKTGVSRAERMQIQNDGKIRMGNFGTTMGALLDVQAATDELASRVYTFRNNGGTATVMQVGDDRGFSAATTGKVLEVYQNTDFVSGGNNGALIDAHTSTLPTILLVKSNGNVGVGVNPTAKFDVSATAANTVGVNASHTAATGVNYGVMSTLTGAGNTNTGFYANASGATTNIGVRVVAPVVGTNNYAIYADGGAQSYFAGKVGIGIVNASNQLDVLNSQNAGTVLGVTNGNAGASALANLTLSSNSGNLSFWSASVAGGGNDYVYGTPSVGANMYVGTSNASTLNLITNNLPRVTVSSTGYLTANNGLTVGATGFTVAGGVPSLLGTANGSVAAPTLANTNIHLYDNGATNWSGIGSSTGGDMYFVAGTSGTPSTRMVIFPNGNISIGTPTDSGYRLDVVGPVRTYGIHSFDGATFAAQDFKVNAIHKGYVATANAVIGGGSDNDLAFDSSSGNVILATGDVSRVTVAATTGVVNISATGGGGNVPHNCAIVSTNSSGTVTASCPAGKIATGGGCWSQLSTIGHATQNPTTTSFICQRTDAGNTIAYAVCCTY